MTRFAFGFPLSFACGGRLAGQACGLAIALPPSILERAVEPIPTVAWFKKVLRFIKVGFMIRAKLEAGGGFVHIEKSAGDTRPGSELFLRKFLIERLLSSL